MFKILKHKAKSFTLIELLIAMTLFSTVSLIVINVYVNITRLQGRIALENAMYEDARFMMERISRYIRNNAVDYEEYFNQAAQTKDATDIIGKYYGCYAARFYDPGLGDVDQVPQPTTYLGSLVNKGSFGALCTNFSALPPAQVEQYIGQNCVVFKPSLDINTGQNPFKNYPSTGGNSNILNNKNNINAFCPFGTETSCTGTETEHTLDNLYLISKDGKTKTIIGRKKVKASPAEFAVGLVEVKGEDPDNDEVTDKWTGCANGNTFCCAPGYDCTQNNSAPTSLLATLDGTDTTNNSGVYKGFIPISPLRSNITHLSFTISPVEDPNKAFAEPGSISQPKVTVNLSITPSQDQLSRFGNAAEIPVVTLQNTISPRVLGEVKSFIGEEANTRCSTLL